MNQILYMHDKKNNKPIDTKKIVLFFAIAIIIFGLILGGQGFYNMYKANKNKKVNPVVEPETPEVIPTILITKTNDNKAIINVQSELPISHIIYNWNSEAPVTLEKAGKTNIEEIINIPIGENVLHISVIDVNGKETTPQETLTIEVPKPVIELSVVGNDIKINVTSQIELSYITYKWNASEEKKEDMNTYVDKTKFEKSLEIPKGQNTLKIVAVDTNGSQTEKSQEIKGITKAKTNVIAQGEYLNFTVTAEENIKTVEFIYNQKKYLMNAQTFGQTNTVKYKVKMVNGWNYLKIISTTNSDAVDTSIWKYEYKTN